MNDVVRTAIDYIKKVPSKEFSRENIAGTIREALIELNGGSTKIDPRKFYRGAELFETIQELIPVIIDEGLKEVDNPILNLVDYRNIADGDLNEFIVKGKAIFAVADTANGIRGVRRQRIPDGYKASVPTTMKLIRVYENLGRLLAGRVDFNDFIQGVNESFQQRILSDAYAAISGVTSSTAGLNSKYIKAGAYDEGELITLIQHVEAATGKVAKIYGTKAALRKVTTAKESDEALSDLYNIGYYGRFNGTEMIMLRQAHIPGTDTFILNDNQLYILAGDDRPIKVVNEGNGILYARSAFDNNDLTEEYYYGQNFGVGIICAEKIGIKTISGE